ncbi:efflux RND transporter periplasmic adaptor subunit [Aliihoeflea aestuarii]|jgi:RND family efflux transporter MFP subunit|uniref:efflux RND transporter periplasmic adaptor subunit n=1 Tax=Aliihoeflea aestuarii TaxID=453840 RepID=UPI0020922635|nr:efflux RND transporter periplasmic adaptor subunit [Aliihoeflea aestuarii]MCO6391912.1 efflux RND transporter periplasmic adaptor subunit [Aliihoeflea aestuarii]
MPIWKQLAICAVLLVAGAVAWVAFGSGTGGTAGPGDGPAISQDTGRGGASGRGAGRPGGGVFTVPVTTATINDRLQAIGTGRAAETVAVTPFASGRLTEILVRSGSTVEAGEIIARLDSQAEVIAVDRARFALEDAESRLERINQLRASNTATQVQVTEAQLGVENARLAVRDAELSLERRDIEAPISGVVGILPVSVGNYVTNSTEIASIDDRSAILVDFWAPERYAGAIEVGATLEASLIAQPNQVFRGEVSAIDNRVDAQSRTLRVEATIDNPSDTLRAGMSFQVVMTFPGETYPAVDPLAVQWGTDGAFVWAVNDGVASRVPVRVIQRNTDSILIAAEIDPGVQVVSEGIHLVREGGDVRIAQRRGETIPAVEARGS